MIVTCKKCGENREVTRDRGTKCKKCQQKSRRKNIGEDGRYHHKCLDCSLEWSTKSDTKAVRCKPCSDSRVSVTLTEYNKDNKVEPKRYTRTCVKCGVVDTLIANPAKRKTQMCGSCSRKYSKRKEGYTRTCVDCGDVKSVDKSRKDTLRCLSCFNKHSIGKKKKTKSTKAKPRRQLKKSAKVPQEAIDKVRKINREHRIAVEKEKKEHFKQILSNEDMIAKFLESSTPSVKFTDEPMGHVEPSPMLVEVSTSGSFYRG